jgi:hypothetical protein
MQFAMHLRVRAMQFAMHLLCYNLASPSIRYVIESNGLVFRLVFAMLRWHGNRVVQRSGGTAVLLGNRLGVSEGKA